MCNWIFSHGRNSRHYVAACAHTTGHDRAHTNPAQPAGPAEWLVSKKASNVRSSDLFIMPEIIPNIISDQASITSQVTDSLGSFKLDRQ